MQTFLQKKERIKRAEKNRELGVERLKLPMIMKPKQKGYCRHYLYGRCNKVVWDDIIICRIVISFTLLGHSLVCHNTILGGNIFVEICSYILLIFILQGKDCMFSHDTVPLTKSQVCLTSFLLLQDIFFN